MAKKILIVDDENDIVQILRAILEHEGYDVISACDGQEGVEKAIAEKPDLIILDVMMPKMDGYEAAAKLKEARSTFAIPIIMLTAKDQQADRDKGLALGIRAYIIKLFDLDELKETVKEVLAGKS